MTLTQDTLINELKDERKQMKTVVVQHTKLMAMLEANFGGKGEEAGHKLPCNGKPHR